MLNMKKTNILVVVLGLSLVALLVAGCGSNSANTNTTPTPSTTPTASSSSPASANNTTPAAGTTATNTTSASAPAAGNLSGPDADQDGIPDTAEKTLGTSAINADSDGDGQSDKVDKDPLFTPSLIQESSTATAPIKVVAAMVEDNVNAADHLEITLANTGKTELKDFDVYYTVIDPVTSAKEGYYLKLTGFTLSPGVTQTLHFDNKKGANHFGGNVNGLYGTSKNGLDFQVMLHTQGFAPVQIPVKKAKGTAEGINSFSYDIIIMDILMPKMDGITLCKTIRKGYPSPCFNADC